MNIVAIGSHYDDIELAVGGSMARWRDSNNTYGIVVTQSNYEDRDYTTARSEGELAASILGYELIRLELPTRNVVYGRELIQLLDRYFVELEADLIITHWEHDVHQDHSAVGKATITAARHFPRILMYRSNWYHSTYRFNPNYYVDISGTISTKIDAIKAHQSEYQKNGEAWLNFHISQCGAAGAIFGVEYAEQFELIKWME